MRTEREPTRTPAPVSLADGPLLIGSFALAAAGLVHLSVAPAHFEEWWAFGTLFLLAAAGQLALALALVLRPTRRHCHAAVALSAGLIATWLISRTTGLPFGPEAGTAERVGVLDLLTTLEEAVLVALVGLTVARSASKWSTTIVTAFGTVGVGLGITLLLAFAGGIGHG